MDSKYFSAEVIAKPKPGSFKARICRFGVPDKGNDVVVKGAFLRSLANWRSANRRIPVVFDHRGDDPLLHVGDVNPHNCEETEEGLVVTGELYLDEERGAKTYAQLKRGALNEWSFGCIVRRARPRSGSGGGRWLDECDLFEVSPTLCGKGDTDTLLVAHAETTGSRGLSVDHALAPYQARITLARARLASARRAS